MVKTESKPTFPALAHQNLRDSLRRYRAALPLCPLCGKVRLARRRFRLLGACQRCARRGVAVSQQGPAAGVDLPSSPV